MSDKSDRKTLNISRYSSRRLYNTGAGEYVTVDDIAKFIRDGHDIKVTDKKSGDDITGQILLQIISDQEAKSGSVLPTNILTDIVRSYTEEGKSLIPKFLSESFEVLKGQREKVSNSFLDQLSNPLDPQKAFNSFEAVREAQTEIAKSVMAAWLPRERKPTQKADEGSKNIDNASDDSDVSNELQLLKQQMEAMQKKLEKLEAK